MLSMSWLKSPGAPYILASIVALAFSALTYHFNSTIANFVIGVGLIALAYGIVLKTIHAVKHSPNDSSLQQDSSQSNGLCFKLKLEPASGAAWANPLASINVQSAEWETRLNSAPRTFD